MVLRFCVSLRWLPCPFPYLGAGDSGVAGRGGAQGRRGPRGDGGGGRADAEGQGGDRIVEVRKEVGVGVGWWGEEQEGTLGRDTQSLRCLADRHVPIVCGFNYYRLRRMPIFGGGELSADMGCAEGCLFPPVRDSSSSRRGGHNQSAAALRCRLDFAVVLRRKQRQFFSTRQRRLYWDAQVPRFVPDALGGSAVLWCRVNGACVPMMLFSRSVSFVLFPNRKGRTSRRCGSTRRNRRPSWGGSSPWPGSGRPSWRSSSRPRGSGRRSGRSGSGPWNSR